eukprot:CAMPEP_0197704080 /NCGR_PEP_ID=MMETSP1338-20131121/125758_1 /TAXON_ID=43686 ORGANISM="Pelagodinium beii, Strain RCC1491" /NCGR_SAMPLE_ID=MMETSP1338 /ASSEMBLY_ACC=CAM_ASM_000754 /LENGTH=1269 /DNA_ID=CAMNT_0043287979 /DNA_START=196 /DNA_END=4006 /DNA_ORIENTATION=-
MTENAPQCQSPTLQTQCLTIATYDAITQRIQTVLGTLSQANCNAQVCPHADFAGCVLRMAGHDFMDMLWDPQQQANPTGGSDGCISFADPDNVGLAPCLTGTGSLHANVEGVGLASIYHDFCTSVSLADFFVIAAEAVMAYTRKMAVDPSNSTFDPGFKSQFKFGRVTSTACEYAAGRMPNPEHGCAATRDVFLDNLLLDWRGAAALMGVHTLGRVHIGNSGYHGWWSDPGNSSLFNNNYYVSMIRKSWTPREVYRDSGGTTRVASGSASGKFQWDIHPRMCQGEASCDQKHLTDANEMMLNTDICLLYTDTQANQFLDTFGDDGCCQWAMPNEFVDLFYQVDQNWCSASPGDVNHPRFLFDQVHQRCCSGDVTCDFADSPGGSAKAFVKEFAENDSAWFEAFKAAWAHATEVHMPATGGGTVLQTLRTTCPSQPSQHQPSFNLNAQQAWQEQRARAEAKRRADENRGYDEAYHRFQGANLSKWFVAAPVDNCAVTCANSNKRCTKRFFDHNLNEVNTYGKVSALFKRLTEANRTRHNGLSGDWFRISDMTEASRQAYNEMNVLGDVSRAVQEEGKHGHVVVAGGGTTPAEMQYWARHNGLSGDWFRISDMTEASQQAYNEMNVLGDVTKAFSSEGKKGTTVAAGGGTTPAEMQYWRKACVDFEYNDTCTLSDTGTRQTYCGIPPLEWKDNSSCWTKLDVQNGAAGLQRLYIPVARQAYPTVWRARGNYRNQFTNITCLRDHVPGDHEISSSSFFPAVFMSNSKGQVPWEIPSCGAPDWAGFLVSDDYCDRAYFDPRWRRACVCEDEEHPRTQTPDGSLQCSRGSQSTTACMHEGAPDPACCSRAISAGCAPGYKYYTGAACKWRVHEQWTTTICCPEPNYTESPPWTQSVGSIADGWYLGRTGEFNCSRVCAEEQRFMGAVTKPAGMYCINENTETGGLDDVSENMSEIIQQIRWRDWQGASTERTPVTCDEIQRPSSTLAFAPSVLVLGTTTFQCNPNWDWSFQGTLVQSACDPNPEAWTTAHGFTQKAQDSWNSKRQVLESQVRRLCKCSSTAPTTLTTTLTQTSTTLTQTVTFGLLCPTGSETRGNGAMCTDESNTNWKGVELRRFRPTSIELCQTACNDEPGCHGFVFFAGSTWTGGCRLYTSCTNLRFQGKKQFAGSVACRHQHMMQHMNSRVNSCPADWLTRGNDAMCTDASLLPWNGGVEVRRYSNQSLSLCTQNCDTDPNCNGFVYWTNSGACRSYTSCTNLLYQGTSEYSGSIACQKAL